MAPKNPSPSPNPPLAYSPDLINPRTERDPTSQQHADYQVLDAPAFRNWFQERLYIEAARSVYGELPIPVAATFERAVAYHTYKCWDSEECPSFIRQRVLEFAERAFPGNSLVKAQISARRQQREYYQNTLDHPERWEESARPNYASIAHIVYPADVPSDASFVTAIDHHLQVRLGERTPSENLALWNWVGNNVPESHYSQDRARRLKRAALKRKVVRLLRENATARRKERGKQYRILLAPQQATPGLAQAFYLHTTEKYFGLTRRDDWTFTDAVDYFILAHLETNSEVIDRLIKWVTQNLHRSVITQLRRTHAATQIQATYRGHATRKTLFALRRKKRNGAMQLEEFTGAQEVESWLRTAEFYFAMEYIPEPRKISALQSRVTSKFRWYDDDRLPDENWIPLEHRGRHINSFRRLGYWLEHKVAPDREARSDAAEARLDTISYKEDEDPYQFREKVKKLLRTAGYRQDRRAARRVMRMLPQSMLPEIRARQAESPDDVFTAIENIYSFSHGNDQGLGEVKTTIGQSERVEKLLATFIEYNLGKDMKTLKDTPASAPKKKECLFCGKNGHLAMECNTWRTMQQQLQTPAQPMPFAPMPLQPRMPSPAPTLSGPSAPLTYQRPQCAYCGRPGHSENQCYTKTRDQQRNASGATPTDTRNCWNCGQPGHVSRNCPQPRIGAPAATNTIEDKSSLLGAPWRRNPPGEERSGPEQRNATTNEARQVYFASPGTGQSRMAITTPVYGWVKIDGLSFRALVDSGSTHSIISQAVAEKCGRLPDRRFKITLSGFNDATSETLGVIRDLPIQTESVLVPTDVQVLAGSRIDVILGVNWFRLAKGVLDMGRLRLSMQFGSNADSMRVYDDTPLLPADIPRKEDASEEGAPHPAPPATIAPKPAKKEKFVKYANQNGEIIPFYELEEQEPTGRLNMILDLGEDWRSCRDDWTRPAVTRHAYTRSQLGGPASRVPEAEPSNQLRLPRETTWKASSQKPDRFHSEEWNPWEGSVSEGTSSQTTEETTAAHRRGRRDPRARNSSTPRTPEKFGRPPRRTTS